MTLIALVGLFALAACASGQHQNQLEYEYQAQPISRHSSTAGGSRAAAAPKPTPVAIIKQINRHNDDGSYTYGYEGGDGSFKIETKLPTGEVSGKYGYVDDTGKLRVVDYGANRYGFQPAGEGITVAPPTLVDETTGKNKEGGFAEYDDESVLFAGHQPQTTARPSARQPKRPRPIQFDVQPQPQFAFQAQTQYAPHLQLQPEYTPQPRTHFPSQAQAEHDPQPRTHFASQAQPQFASQPRTHFASQAQAEYASQPRSHFASQAQAQYAPHLESQPRFIQYQTQQRTASPVRQVQPAPARFYQQIPFDFQQQTRQQQFPRTHFEFEQPRHGPSASRVVSPSPSRATVPGSVPSGPLFRPHPIPASIEESPRPAPVREHHPRQVGSSASVLDSLIKQYALPQGVGQPLHDITFGSYSSQTNY